MEDYIYQIRSYLPIKFIDSEANDFLKYLEETYLDNIKNNKYQFAFKAFHMLYMTFIYKISWFVKFINKDNSEEVTFRLKIKSDGQAQIQEKKYSIKQMFEYSLIGESKAIQVLLKKKGFHPNDYSKCQYHVDARNHCSHASGKIEYNEKGIDYLISDELKYVERFQNKIKPELKTFIETFLNDNWNKSLIGGDIEHTFTNNNISGKDLEFIIDFALSLFKKKSDNEKVVFQKILYLVFVYEAQKYLEIEKNIFLEKLPMLMFGLVEEMELKQDGRKKKVLVQEIIEERIIPIISRFVDEERKEAEKILKLE